MDEFIRIRKFPLIETIVGLKLKVDQRMDTAGHNAVFHLRRMLWQKSIPELNAKLARLTQKAA